MTVAYFDTSFFLTWSLCQLSKWYVLVVVFASFSVTQTLQKQATILRAGPQHM